MQEALNRGAARTGRLSLNWPVLLAAACLLLSLGVRLRGLDVFLTADELKWTCRTVNFRTALSRGDLARTFQVGHPGVITMWAGSLGLPRDLGGDWSDVCQETRITRLAVAIGHEQLAELGKLTFLARRPVAIITWLCTLAIVWLAAQLFGATAGLMAAILVGLDPFFLALSRVLHLDALAGSFVIVSFLALLVALKGRKLGVKGASDLPESSKLSGRWTPGRWTRVSPYLVASGLVAGLGFLNKSPSLFLGPVAVALIVASAWRARRPGEPAWRPLVPALTWCVAAGAATLALWPALWVDPVGTTLAVLGKATGYAAEGHDNLNFFLGQIVNDPGPLFYPVVWAFRTTPLVWLGLLALAWRALLTFPKAWSFREGGARSRQVAKSSGESPHPNPRVPIGMLHPDGSPTPPLRQGHEERPRIGASAALLLVLAFGIAYILFMSAGAKKFDRYIVPTFLAVDVVAAVGLARLVDLLGGRRARQPGSERGAAWVPLAAGLVLAIVGTAIILPYGTYLFSYFNPLLGGGAAAQQIMLVGWGEGLDGAAAYLNAQPGSRDMRVGTRYISDFGPLFAGFSDGLDAYNPARADYLVFYVNQVQRRLSDDALRRYFGVEQPEHVVRMFGIDYAWIYANTDHKAAVDYLDSHADPAHDAVLLNGSSRFQRFYTGPLPVYVVDGEWDEPRIVAGLSAAASGRRRLWYLTYPDGDNDSHGLIQHQLDTHTWRGEMVPLPTSHLTPYDLVDASPFRLPVAGQPVDLRFGPAVGDPSIRLRGFGVDPAPAQFGRGLSLALDWEALRPPGEDLSAFVHLEDAAGHLAGQGDRQIFGDGQPTSRWAAGQSSLNRYVLQVFPGTPPGRYRIKVGVYRTQDNTRLVFKDAAGTPSSAWLLGEIEVAPSPVVPTREELGLKETTPVPVLSSPAGTSVTLLGVQVPPEVRTGDSLSTELFWEVGAAPAGDYSLRLSLTRGGEPSPEMVADVVPPAGDYPTSRWRPGERLRSWTELPVPNGTPGGEARLRVQFVDAAGRPAGEPVDVGQVRVVAVERIFELPPDVQHSLDVRLGDQIALAGYSLAAGPGCAVGGGSTPCAAHLTLYWKATGRPERDYTVFAHLLDANGQLRAQVDRAPSDGKRPTSGWVVGEVVADEYDLALPVGAPSGTYHVVAGMYDAATLQRLPAASANGGRLTDDRVEVGELEVGLNP